MISRAQQAHGLPDKKRLPLLIQHAFKSLLSEKHLYQSITAAPSFVDESAKALFDNANARPGYTGRCGDYELKRFTETARKEFSKQWIPAPLSVADVSGFLEAKICEAAADGVLFELPHIRATCTSCGGSWPHNPLDSFEFWQQGKHSSSNQWYLLAYECQDCKCEPIRFLVRRSGGKLTICGRDPIEPIEVPKFLPKNPTLHYRNALLAFQTGQHLSAIFQLRVFIEQHWLGIPEIRDSIPSGARPTGDELGALYKQMLPPDFKDRFPTLAESYEILSAAMHKADPNPETFETARGNILKHFDALRIFGIKFVQS